MKKHSIPMMLILFMVLGMLLFLFMFLPVVNVILSTSYIDFFAAIISSDVQYAIFLSFYTAAVATIIAITLGTPLAYILARRDFLFKKFIDSIIDIPILLPHTVAGIALLTLFGESGILGSLLLNFGIRFIDTIFGIIIAQLFVSAPFYIKTVRESFENIDPRYHNVARTLGATPSKAFLQIELPLAIHGILTGSILCWARAISEFGAVIILAYYPPVAPVLIYQQFVLYGLGAALPTTAVLIILTLGVFIILKYIQSKSPREHK